MESMAAVAGMSAAAIKTEMGQFSQALGSRRAELEASDGSE